MHYVRHYTIWKQRWSIYVGPFIFGMHAYFVIMLVPAPVAHSDDLFYDAMMRNLPAYQYCDGEFTWER